MKKLSLVGVLMAVLAFSCSQEIKEPKSHMQEGIDKTVIGFRPIPGVDTFYNVAEGKEYYIKNNKLYPDSFGLIETVCDEENTFIYSEKEIKRRIADNYGSYLVRGAERNLDTIVNYQRIHFIMEE